MNPTNTLTILLLLVTLSCSLTTRIRKNKAKTNKGMPADFLAFTKSLNEPATVNGVSTTSGGFAKTCSHLNFRLKSYTFTPTLEAQCKNNNGKLIPASISLYPCIKANHKEKKLSYEGKSGNAGLGFGKCRFCRISNPEYIAFKDFGIGGLECDCKPSYEEDENYRAKIDLNAFITNIDGKLYGCSTK